MAPASQPAAIAELRRRLERMKAHGGEKAAVLPFGIAAVDGQLPGGGLCRGHLHEILEAGPASEHAGLAALFAAGILARLAGPVLWCLRGRDLFAPALARIGLHPDRVIYCETWKDRDVLIIDARQDPPLILHEARSRQVNPRGRVDAHPPQPVGRPARQEERDDPAHRMTRRQSS
jgi:hypothetical protein